MTASEIVKKLDDTMANQVNLLNALLDNEKTFEEQSAGWQRLFSELNGMVKFARNIAEHWLIVTDFVENTLHLKSIRIVSDNNNISCALR